MSRLKPRPTIPIYEKACRLCLFVFTEPAVIVRDGILVARRHCAGIAAAYLAGLFVVQLTPQLQLELVHVGEYLRVELFDKGGISGETAVIQALHLANQFLNLTLHFGVFPDSLAKLVQIAHAVIVSALGRNRRIVGLNRGTSARCVISRIKIVVHAADASAAGIGVAIASTVGSVTEPCSRAADRSARSLAALLTPLLPSLALPLTLPLLLALLATLTIASE